MILRIQTVIAALILALSLFNFTVSATPTDSADLVLQGNELIKTKDYAKALAAYERAITLDKNYFPAWNGKADALNRAGNFTEALAASDVALALEPSSTAGWINRGYILYNLGRYDDELRAYETAVSLDPGNAEAWFNKGYSLAGLKRYDEAIAAFDKVQAIRPDYPNLAGNRRIAEQLRDAGTPTYVRYGPMLAGILIFVMAVGGYLLYRRKNPPPSEGTDTDNRQSRRRKERKTE